MFWVEGRVRKKADGPEGGKARVQFDELLL